MPLRIAYPTRVGGDVQMPRWQWQDVINKLSRTYPTGPDLARTISEALPEGDAGEHVRIPLTHAQIEQVRQVVEG